MKPYCCTFISKERRVEPGKYDEYSRNLKTENSMTLWRNDRGNAAAVFLADTGLEHAEITVTPPVDEHGAEGAGISVQAGFQKYISTYEGSNWIPRPRPYIPPEPPSGNRSYSPDVICRPQTGRDPAAESEGKAVYPFWITVDVSADAAPGIYRSRILVTTDRGEQSELVQSIRVLNLTLKESPDYYLNLWQYPYAAAEYYRVTPFSEEHLEIMKNQMKPYLEAGGKTGTASIVEEPWYHQTYCGYPSMVKWKKENGTWSFDYHDFDIWADFLIRELELPYVECYSIVPWENILRYTEDGEQKEQRAKPGTELWGEAWSAFLEDFVRHLDEKGWFDHIIIAMDERPLEEMEAALDLLESVRNKERKSLKAGGAVNHYRQEIWDRLFTVTPHLSNIRASEIPPELFRSEAKRRRERGQLTSIYSMIGDYPGTFSLSDPGEIAWIIWYVESCGADGFLKWAYDAWCENPLEDNAHAYFEAGDMFLIYPGKYRGAKTKPGCSPRFQMMAEAIRDVRKLRQLSRMSPKYETRAAELLSGVKQFYGTGESNGIGTAGFITAGEAVKEALAEEVRRLHRQTEELLS